MGRGSPRAANTSPPVPDASAFHLGDPATVRDSAPLANRPDGEGGGPVRFLRAAFQRREKRASHIDTFPGGGMMECNVAHADPETEPRDSRPCSGAGR